MLSGGSVSVVCEVEVVSKRFKLAEPRSVDICKASLMPFSGVLPDRVIQSGSVAWATCDVRTAVVDAIMVEATSATLCEAMTALTIMTSWVSCGGSPWPMKGNRRVHQNAMRSPRSTMRCFRMKSTTRAKNARVAKISIRSNQSAFSRAVTSCFEVPSSPVSRS